MSKYNIVNKFIEYMKVTYGITYNSIQINNFEILYETLESKSKIAQIVPISMGEGKSQFIEFYCNYKYDIDKEFSAVIVKKTINECDGFCIGLGMKKEFKKADIFNVPYGFYTEDQSYHGAQSYTMNGYIKYDYLPEYEKFKAYTLKGFNFKDCVKYKDINTKKETNKQIRLIESVYDNRLCSSCESKCPIHKLKYHMKKFIIIAIAHSRLFWSNNIKDILDNILYYENGKGEKVKRKLLIIDEKISMFYRDVLRIENFNKLKNYINNCGNENDKKLINKYENAICGLDFVDKTMTLKNPVHIKEEFSQKLISKIFNDKESKTIEKSIAFLERISNFSQIHTFRNNLYKRDEDNREIAVTQYLDLSNYAKYFDNTIITDATATRDLEYCKSSKVIIDSIVPIKKPINWYRPLKDCRLTKQAIKKDYDKMLKIIGEECSNIIEKNRESKTLIVSYQWVFNENDTYMEKIAENITSNKELYEIIYFNQYTTGVNYFRDYENIIFLGQLRKGQFYEETKEFVFKDKFCKQELINNEFLIDTVQQIGRTSYRKNITPNVYFFENHNIVDYLESELSNFFNVNVIKYDNEKLYYERTYNNINREKDSVYGHFLRFINSEYQKLKVNKKEYKLEDIKKAIGYMKKDHKREFLDKSKAFVTYDKKSKIVVVDFEKAKDSIREVLGVDI